MPAFPNIAQLAAYKLTILENVACASGREDHQSVAQWVLIVEKGVPNSRTLPTRAKASPPSTESWPQPSRRPWQES